MQASTAGLLLVEAPHVATETRLLAVTVSTYFKKVIERMNRCILPAVL